MSLWQRLRAIDARFVRWRYRRYDEPPPFWMETGSFIGSATGVCLIVAIQWGGIWWAVATVLCAGTLAFMVAASRWQRAHRKKEPANEFDIAVDRR